MRKRKSRKQWSGAKTRKNLLSPETGWGQLGEDTIAVTADN